MLLLVDVGNTRVKWAQAALTPDGNGPGRWHASGSVALEHIAQLEPVWRDLHFTRVMITNVAGTATREALTQMLLRIGTQVGAEWFVSLPTLAGVRNGYRNPSQLGSDRFAAAIGARAVFPRQDLLLVTCGTATTIDALGADGLFIGGLILPGLNVMASALARNTAQLPSQLSQLLQQGEHLPLFADNTDDAIMQGCIAAQVGAIERTFTAHAAMKPNRSIQCVIAGGASTVILPHLAIPYVHVDNLVLLGLQTAAYLETPNC